MKFLVLFSCAFAVVAAQWAPAHQGAYHGPYHVPVLTAQGVPQETPEVQAARASHLAAFSGGAPHAAYQGANNGQYNGAYNNGQYNGNDDGQYREHRYYGPPAYQTTNGAAKVSAGGVPLDTPEVAAAKANHFSAFSDALSRGAHFAPGHHYRKRRSYAPWAHHGAYHGPYHVPVIGPHGVPLDTPEVQHARAAHLAALASANHGPAGHYGAGPIYAHGYAHGFQGLDHDGRPLDTPEVAHAKAAHFAAFNEAAHRNGVHGHVGYGGGYASPYGYPNGAPHDTPEVAHAKAAHFAAHAAARAGHHGHY